MEGLLLYYYIITEYYYYTISEYYVFQMDMPYDSHGFVKLSDMPKIVNSEVSSTVGSWLEQSGKIATTPTTHQPAAPVAVQ